MFCNVPENNNKKRKYYSLKRSPPTEATFLPKSVTNCEPTVKKFFKKKFHFRKPLHWKLPPIDNIFTGNERNRTVPQLQWIKNELNNIKDKLNDYPLDAWSKFTAKRDPSSGIAWYLRNEVKAEFVTNAWCKFYECLSAYPIVKINGNGEFNSVHLCEAPGAFVAALNHYLKLNHPEAKFQWCATTLNPYYEGNSFDNAVLDDRLMVRTFDNWEFGDDFTGDLTNKPNVEKLVSRCRKMGKISLVTADGSVDCVECPHDQENKVHYLHFAEVVAALQILDMGGTFVLKMFAFFELTTVGLLYFLVNSFDKVDVFKPAASKQGNSEVYVICSGYQRIYKNLSYLMEMANQMNRNDAPMFTSDTISNDFIDQVANCAKMFMYLQTEAIQLNIFHFRRSDIDDQQRLHELRNGIRKEYVRFYGVKPIADKLKLLQGERFSDERNICAPVVAFSGSLTSRLMFRKSTSEEKTLELRTRRERIEKRISYQNRHEHSPLVTNQRYDEILHPFYGQPILKIVSSKFVLNQCLKLMLEILANVADSSQNNETITPSDNSIISINSALQQSIIISIDIIGYKNIQIYDKFEKQVFHQLVNVINFYSPDKIRIRNFLLLTHFSVGFVYALGCVYKEIVLTTNGEIQFNCLRSNGKDFLNNVLMNRIDFVASSTNPNRSVLSVVKVILLRNNIDFNNAVIDYNNNLSLKYCKTLLE